ncbi:MAG: LacI family transcriptional regulator [Alicyclobacillus sp.]|nr:LacI family transcriptional regulator [Alicyclobacillus sp.]
MKKGKSVTIQDVADAANVSRSLVSFVLNGRSDVAEETRNRILRAIEELGYRPSRLARNLARNQAGAVGYVLPAHHQDPMALQMLGALLEALTGSSLRLMVLRHDYEDLLDALDERAVDSLFLMDVDEHDSRASALLGHFIPVSSIWNHIPEASLAHGLRQLAQLLAQRGHTDVWVMGSYRSLSVRVKPLLVQFLSEAGLSLAGWEEGVISEEQAMAAAASILERARPSALVALSDTAAMGALQGIRQRRLRVPEDIAVTGLGDIPAARWTSPPLTTVRVPFPDLGRALVAPLAGQRPPDMPACQLMIRRSG